MDRYRTISPRFLALIIDTLILVPVILIGVIVLMYDSSPAFVFAFDLLFVVVSLAYNILLHWKYGQTVGKMVMKLKVVDSHEGSITLRQAVLRDVFYVLVSPFSVVLGWLFLLSGEANLIDKIPAIDTVTYVLTFLWLVIDTAVCVKHEKDRALHDLIAGTVVVRLDVPESTDESKLEPPGPEHYDELRAA